MNSVPRMVGFLKQAAGGIPGPRWIDAPCHQTLEFLTHNRCVKNRVVFSESDKTNDGTKLRNRTTVQRLTLRRQSYSRFNDFQHGPQLNWARAQALSCV